MERLRQALGSSIGRKALVALAGLLLCGFLVTHLAGNLFLLAGEGSFNHYAETLESNPLLIPAEIALAGLFLLHILFSLKLRLENSAARPTTYAAGLQGKGARTWGSRTMALSGLLTLAFLAVHIRTFKFADKPEGLYRLVMASFANPFYSLFYVAAMGGLCLHLSHGFQSAFQTLGANHPKYTPWLKRLGLTFALAIAGGFAALPVWAYLAATGRLVCR